MLKELKIKHVCLIKNRFWMLDILDIRKSQYEIHPDTTDLESNNKEIIARNFQRK